MLVETIQLGVYILSNKKYSFSCCMTTDIVLKTYWLYFRSYLQFLVYSPKPNVTDKYINHHCPHRLCK